MILIKPSVEILSVSPMALELLEGAGRTCYKSEAKITPDSSRKFVASLIKRGHESVIEHASVSVRFICDRGVSHEIVRHRIASYSQESTRYCNYRGDVTFVIPPWCEGGTVSYDIWRDAMVDSAYAYSELLASGWPPEQARSVLPNSLKTELVMTTNFRSWRNFFQLRTAPTAHVQMREVAIPLLEKMKVRVPIIFDDIIPDVEGCLNEIPTIKA